MPIYKNKASQKIAVIAIDTSDGSLKTGDAGNITAQISKDGGANAATDDANPAELDNTNHPGVYIFDMLQAETNADLIVLTASSSTGNISLGDPMLIYTDTEVDTSTLATEAELDKVPKSDSNVTWNATALASMKTQSAAVMTDANTELASIPTTTGGLRTMIQFLHQYFRGVRTEVSNAESLKKEDGSTELGSRTLADAAGTFTRGEMN